jgi:hypothetical protein
MDLNADPDPAVFVSDLQDVNKKKLFQVFCLLLFEASFTSFFKEKSHKEVTKQQESRFIFFLLFLRDDGRIRTSD